MTIASWKDLCIDAGDTPVMADFWAAALGRRVGERRDESGLIRLDGPTPRHTVWVNPVPEPVMVKQRVHLDVHVADHRDLLRLGATAADTTSFPWQVLLDPEGGELCAFERAEVPGERLYEIVVDSADPPTIGRWWAEVMGGRLTADEEHGWVAVEEIPGAPYECLVFVPVPEPKTVKNRIHWDVDTADVALLEARGARVLRRPDPQISWTVLADPEGNEFCAFVD